MGYNDVASEKRKQRIDYLRSKIEKEIPLCRHTQHLTEAIKCFHVDMPIACIVVSSALTERTLFWQKAKRNPTEKAGIKEPLGGLFGDLWDFEILQNTLLDKDEQLDLRLKQERKRSLCDIKDMIGKAKYVQTRNLFAHGKLAMFPASFRHLLPANTFALSEYGIDQSEWDNPPLTTIAYVHLSKTLGFLKAVSALV